MFTKPINKCNEMVKKKTRIIDYKHFDHENLIQIQHINIKLCSIVTSGR